MTTTSKGFLAGLVLALSGCTAMTGYDPTARTAAPDGDRFARAWCEAETKGGSLVACGSSRVPTVQFGEPCNCIDPEQDAVLLGRVVSRPKATRLTAASPAFTDLR